MGEMIGGNRHCPLQKRRERKDGLTVAKRPAFLAELEASCNVRRACDAVGISKSAAYGMRLRDPVFAAAWSAALERGCETLRALMLSRALGTADAELIADNAAGADVVPRDPEPMSDEMRLKVLQICRASAEGQQGRGNWRQPRALVQSGDDAFAVLADKLDRMEKKLRRDAQA